MITNPTETDPNFVIDDEDSVDHVSGTDNNRKTRLKTILITGTYIRTEVLKYSSIDTSLIFFSRFLIYKLKDATQVSFEYPFFSFYRISQGSRS